MDGNVCPGFGSTTRPFAGPRDHFVLEIIEDDG